MARVQVLDEDENPHITSVGAISGDMINEDGTVTLPENHLCKECSE